jgi:hypothetical protein
MFLEAIPQNIPDRHPQNRIVRHVLNFSTGKFTKIDGWWLYNL